jgi:hypothetical protein
MSNASTVGRAQNDFCCDIADLLAGPKAEWRLR